MSKINKISSGLLFFDDFSEKTLMWTQSPSDINCLSFGDDGLQIQHNNSYITYTIVEPEMEQYSCVVQLDHTPLSEEDIAGVIVMSTTKDYAECQSYMAKGPSEITNGGNQISGDLEELIYALMNERLDTYVTYSVDDSSTSPIAALSIDLDATPVATSTDVFVDKIYKYIKFSKEKTKYRFLASTDGFTWIEIGNTTFKDAGVIGFFLYGTENEDIISKSHCYFNTFAIYSDKYITIDGIEENHEIEIYNEDIVYFRSDNTAYSPLINRAGKRLVINTMTLPTPIKNAQLRIFPNGKYKTTISNFELSEELYGGDSFTIERDIRLYIDNKEINPLELYDLGTFYRGSYFVKLDLHNNEDYILTNVKVRVIKYSEYYGGEEEVAVALYDESHAEKDLPYAKEVVIDSINPSEGKSIYIKLMDRPIQDFYMTANSYRFKIMIE